MYDFRKIPWELGAKRATQELARLPKHILASIIGLLASYKLSFELPSKEAHSEKLADAIATFAGVNGWFALTKEQRKEGVDIEAQKAEARKEETDTDTEGDDSGDDEGDEDKAPASKPAAKKPAAKKVARPAAKKAT